MKIWSRLFVTTMVIFAFCLAVQTTIFTVAVNGSSSYITVDATAVAGGTNIVRGMDFATYNERVGGEIYL